MISQPYPLYGPLYLWKQAEFCESMGCPEYSGRDTATLRAYCFEWLPGAEEAWLRSNGGDASQNA